MDKYSKAQRSDIMRKIKSTNTKPEVLFRKELLKQGWKYQKKTSKLLKGKPDVVFPKFKTVIFVDGCFWHGCPYHYRRPSSNKKYWSNKITTNKVRDGKINKYYKKNGWNCIRIWEHSINKNLHNLLKVISIKLKIAN
jgi:DNA mismatch endonuclease (patch repair protein)